MSGEVFRFKPAALRRARNWRLEDGVLSLSSDGGEDWSLPLDHVTGLALIDTTIRRTRMRRLDLKVGSVTRRIGINIDMDAPPDDPDLGAHLALMQAIAAHLAAGRPALPVTLGETGRTRLALFVIGVLSVLFAIGITAASMITGLSGDRLAGASVPVILLFVFGIAIGGNNLPWKGEPALPVSLLPAILEHMARRD
ncbi:MAG: hypothetical protein KDK00_01485 [Rhodobacteraceae bacterium]|nr:hypothetical protein [Paracoccaceae bacterium]